MTEYRKISLFDTEEETKELEELKRKIYTTKIVVPQYLPSEICPSLSDCVDTTKYEYLINEINNANISENDKIFLRLAACRHLKFTYDKIADYYAHSDKKVQELFEHSGLVILDIKDAIAQGYVILSTKLDSIMGEEIDE